MINPQLLDLSEQFQLTGEIRVTQHWPAFLWPGQPGQVKLTIENSGGSSDLTASGLALAGASGAAALQFESWGNHHPDASAGRVQHMIWTIDSSHAGSFRERFGLTWCGRVPRMGSSMS